MTDAPRTKLAVLGGGLGAITAAYYLTSPELAGKYEVTVYTQGWRLGGKGASGRNHALADRIEEHGLHAFLGFYENAFSTMRAAYRDWKKKPENPFQSWRDAFTAERRVTLAESPDEAGEWKTWTIDVPPLPGEPGDGGPTTAMEDKLAKLIDWLRSRTSEGVSALPEDVRARLKGARGAASLVDEAPAASERHGASEPRGGCLPILDMLHDLARFLGVEREEPPERRKATQDFLDELRSFIDRELAPLRGIGDDLRRLHVLLDLGCAAARGIVVDVIPGGGFSAIDDWDFKDWLEHHGASPLSAWSAPVRALYDLGFAYVGGREGRDNARASAGVALCIALEMMFGSRGALLWKMESGMGDTIFSPLYEILVERGVRVEFFRRVENLGLSADGGSIESIVLSHQVELGTGRGRYDPLVDVAVDRNKGHFVLPCWPSEPRWEQIEGGEALRVALEKQGLTLESAWCGESVRRETLLVGNHFDVVVLGISIGALADCCPELQAESEAWRAMMGAIETVQTQAFQLWLSPDLPSLGWTEGSTTLTGYAEPFDTWGDMTHLVPKETWPETETPGSIAYFCSAMPDASLIPPRTDSAFPKREQDRVREAARGFCSWRLGLIWPKAVLPIAKRPLDWSRLVDLGGAAGPARFDAQYFRANIDPSERYVLSVPGSTRHRLHAKSADFSNLYLAGDWTWTSLQSGCAEAAIESGMRASQALSGVPAVIHRTWT